MATPTSNDGSSSAETAREIKSILQQLRKSSRQRKRGSGNAGDDRDDALRLDKLRKIFARLVEEGDFDLTAAGGGDGGGNSASSQWKTWLAAQHEAFVSHLIEAVIAGKTTALRAFCGVLASSPADVRGLSKGDDNVDGPKTDERRNGMVSERLLNKMLEACVKSRQCLDAINRSGKRSNGKNSNKNSGEGGGNEQLVSEEAMLTLLESEFVRPHRDVQYFVCKGVHQIALDLLGGLDQAQKRLVSKRTKNEGDEDRKPSRDGGDDSIAKAETNVGIVAENMCRLLMMMDYVPKTQDDLIDDAGFLYPPPILSGNGDEAFDDDDVDDGAMGADGSEDDDDSEGAPDSSSDEEEAITATKKRKKQTPGSGGNSKRHKRTKLIAWQQPYKHRHAHQEAWLSVLRLPNLPARTQKLVLQHLSEYVLNVCPSPLRFAEYFTRSFRGGSTSAGGNSGGLAAILSLHGLFVLMLDHQLEYPQFYNSLYALLHPRILYTKHRSRFLRLLSKALLSNSMLPAYVVGSFCKKLCRLALSGPPSGGLFVLALVGNLLRKYGECACLIHRRGVITEDVFVEQVDDLVKSRALESSLWELTALEKHYHHAISTLAKSVGTEDDKTTPMHDMEDFMAHTYKSLFEQEKKRLGSDVSVGGGGGVGNDSKGQKKKRKGGGTRVSLTFVEPEGLFTKNDVFADSFQCSALNRVD